MAVKLPVSICFLNHPRSRTFVVAPAIHTSETRIPAGKVRSITVRHCCAGKKQKATGRVDIEMTPAGILHGHGHLDNAQCSGHPAIAADHAQFRTRCESGCGRRSIMAGDRVKAGQPLFAIDDRDYRAAVAQGEAAVAAAKASIPRHRPEFDLAARCD